jgi:hypothetical protein
MMEFHRYEGIPVRMQKLWANCSAQIFHGPGVHGKEPACVSNPPNTSHNPFAIPATPLPSGFGMVVVGECEMPVQPTPDRANGLLYRMPLP